MKPTNQLRTPARCFAACLLFGLLAAGPARAQGNNPCDMPGETPDIITGDMFSVTRFGKVGDVTAFSFSFFLCNEGSCWANCVQNTNDHPVIAQNLFRLRDGRLEQIGQSWLMHLFLCLSDQFCASGCIGTDGTHLGVRCADPETAGVSGHQGNLGPRSEVNASTGVFPFPFGTQGQTGNAIYKRLQAHDADLDPALNSGAQYFVEIQSVAKDDAAADTAQNNASYRPVVVSGSGGIFNLALAGTAVRGKPAVNAWRVADPDVSIVPVRVEGDGWFYVGAKATDLGGGLWRYEYAVQNLNSHRSAGSFRVPLPFGANASNIGFHDVDSHSGEPYDLTDWANNGGQGLELSWETTPFAVNPNANALRWGTLYNFRFDADVPPATGDVTIGLFRSGTAGSIAVTTVTPQLCNTNGVCDPGETCANCLADCSNQGGNGGCCGDASCDTGEDPCSCFADCGSPPPVEFSCSDGEDADCDGLGDCVDADCCSSCAGPDGDDDGFASCDCDDADPTVWSQPGEVENLLLAKEGGATRLTWDAPLQPGSAALSYETLHSQNPVNFRTSSTCVIGPDPSDTTAVDGSDPAVGTGHYYVVRAVNACPPPQDEGSLGRNSHDQPIAGRSCP